MKSEKQRRNKLDISSERDCVHCNNCHPKVIEDAGRTRTQLPNGQWSEETVCDMYDIICTIDKKSKGFVFSPYESLAPVNCPLEKKKDGLFRKIFQSFFRF